MSAGSKSGTVEGAGGDAGPLPSPKAKTKDAKPTSTGNPVGHPTRGIDFAATYGMEFMRRVLERRASIIPKVELRELSNWGVRQGAAKLGGTPYRSRTIRDKLRVWMRAKTSTPHGIKASLRAFVESGGKHT